MNLDPEFFGSVLLNYQCQKISELTKLRAKSEKTPPSKWEAHYSDICNCVQQITAIENLIKLLEK